jgi:hypothetical protein
MLHVFVQLAWPPEALGDIMHALELLHEYAGMLHGDIEKCNLMFRYPPVPVGQAAGVLIDLGNARPESFSSRAACIVQRLGAVARRYFSSNGIATHRSLRSFYVVKKDSLDC